MRMWCKYIIYAGKDNLSTNHYADAEGNLVQSFVCKNSKFKDTTLDKIVIFVNSCNLVDLPCGSSIKASALKTELGNVLHSIAWSWVKCGFCLVTSLNYKFKC